MSQHPPSILEQISTRWPMISDPAKFMLRYAPAIERYLTAILRDPHAVADVTGDLLLRVVHQNFVPEQVTRGRFRDYLKAVVRNAAYAYLRREQARPTVNAAVELLASPSDDPIAAADLAYNEQWRDCLLERVWDDLDKHQREHPGSHCYDALRIIVDHQQARSPEQATLLSERIGEPVRADAFRKKVSRARELFTRYLMREVAATLPKASVEAIEEELADLGLLEQVLALLPDDWRERGDLLDL